MVLNSEVLPAPFGPITAVMLPGWTAKPTPPSARTPPNDSVRPSTSSKGPVGPGGAICIVGCLGFVRETRVLLGRKLLTHE